MNSSHFISFGTIPGYKAPTYFELRNRKTKDGWNWINDDMKNVMSQKLYDNHKRDTQYEIFEASCKYYVCLATSKLKLMIPKSLKKIIKNALHR